MQIQVGDIFTIPMCGKYFGGVVQLRRKTEYFITIFSPAACDSVQVEQQICANPKPILCGITMDARFHSGDWTIVGNNRSLAQELPQPIFALLRLGVPIYEEFSTALIQIESVNDSSSIPSRRVTVSPVRFDNAVRAICEGRDWDDSFAKIEYGNYFTDEFQM